MLKFEHRNIAVKTTYSVLNGLQETGPAKVVQQFEEISGPEVAVSVGIYHPTKVASNSIFCQFQDPSTSSNSIKRLNCKNLTIFYLLAL